MGLYVNTELRGSQLGNAFAASPTNKAMLRVTNVFIAKPNARTFARFAVFRQKWLKPRFDRAPADFGGRINGNAPDIKRALAAYGASAGNMQAGKVPFWARVGGNVLTAQSIADQQVGLEQKVLDRIAKAVEISVAIGAEDNVGGGEFSVFIQWAAALATLAYAGGAFTSEAVQSVSTGYQANIAGYTPKIDLSGFMTAPNTVAGEGAGNVTTRSPDVLVKQVPDAGGLAKTLDPVATVAKESGGLLASVQGGVETVLGLGATAVGIKQTVESIQAASKEPMPEPPGVIDTSAAPDITAPMTDNQKLGKTLAVAALAGLALFAIA